MSPRSAADRARLRGAPRSRGDEPGLAAWNTDTSERSPLARG